jgi:hypothetical protein
MLEGDEAEDKDEEAGDDANDQEDDHQEDSANAGLDASNKDDNNGNPTTAFDTSWEVRVARLYEKTIVGLGPLMDARLSIGISSGGGGDE